MTEALPVPADFSRGGKYNISGLLTPMAACERFYLYQNIGSFYSMPEGEFSLDSWMASDDS